MTPRVTTRDQLPVMLMVLIGQPPSGHRSARAGGPSGGHGGTGASRMRARGGGLS